MRFFSAKQQKNAAVERASAPQPPPMLSPSPAMTNLAGAARLLAWWATRCDPDAPPSSVEDTPAGMGATEVHAVAQELRALQQSQHPLVQGMRLQQSPPSPSQLTRHSLRTHTQRQQRNDPSVSRIEDWMEEIFRVCQVENHNDSYTHSDTHRPQPRRRLFRSNSAAPSTPPRSQHSSAKRTLQRHPSTQPPPPPPLLQQDQPIVHPHPTLGSEESVGSSGWPQRRRRGASEAPSPESPSLGFSSLYRSEVPASRSDSNCNSNRSSRSSGLRVEFSPSPAVTPPFFVPSVSPWECPRSRGANTDAQGHPLALASALAPTR